MTAEGAAAAPALVVIDPSPAQRERLAAAADALGGVPVVALAPGVLGPAALAALAGARGVVVAWDLGVRAGLDVVEALAHDPATGGVPAALAVEAPTRVHIELALRAGARTVVRRPYDPGEIARALWAGTGSPPAAGADDTSTVVEAAPPGAPGSPAHAAPPATAGVEPPGSDPAAAGAQAFPGATAADPAADSGGEPA